MERNIQSRILQYLNSKDIYTVKVVSATRRGVPDILCCFKGRFVAFEVKDEGKEVQVSELQKANLKMIRESGGEAYVVSSVEAVIQILSEL